MKKQILSFVIEKPKVRAHYALFCENTPFKPKVVDSKDRYKRQQKHRNKDPE